MKEQDYNISIMLKNLGINDINPGASTGANWMKCQGDITSSISPIDGKEIAKVQNASIEEYESVVQKAHLEKNAGSCKRRNCTSDWTGSS